MSFYRFNPSDYAVGGKVHVADGGWRVEVVEYTIEKITPSGQIVASRKIGTDRTDTIRLSPKGSIVGAGTWSRRSAVSAERAIEIVKENVAKDQWSEIAVAAGVVEKAARRNDAAELKVALAALTSAFTKLGETA